MINIPVLSFNSGELSPQIDARSDVAKYASGCRTLSNFIPRVYGSAEQRPGTKYIGDAKESDKTIRMEDFSYSDTIAYVCEFGENYIRFYYNGARVLGPLSPTAWADETDYVMGQFVTYAGTIYRCLVAHTSDQGGGIGGGDRPSVDVSYWIRADLDDDNYPICETPTPYQEDDLLELQMRQIADTMWIIHNSYQPRKLTRTSTTTFDLSTITIDDGPFKKRNDEENDDDVTLTPSATTGNITLTASSATFNTGHIGALFKITQPRATSYVYAKSRSTDVAGTAITAAIDVKGEFSFTTTGTWDKIIQLQRNVNGEGWEEFRTYISKSDARINVNTTYVEEDNNVQYRAYLVEQTSGDAHCIIKVHDSTQSGIARVTAYTSPTKVSATVLTTFACTEASYRWYEGAWSNSAGWPSAFTFFEERAIYGGSSDQPQTIWLSCTGDYEKFDETETDSSAFWVTMAADKQNRICWLSALEALCIGTNGGEWRMRATSLDEQLTYKNFDLKQQTAYGAKKIQPQAVGSSVLFVDFVGRKVREMAYVDAKQKFESPDLAALAEHITIGSITSIAFQKNPDMILWCTLATGELLSMVYERDQNVIAWSKHPLGGTSAACDSVSVIPQTDEDQVWLCVSKTVNGSTVRHIEQMQPRVDVDFEDCWFVDDGLNWDGGDPVTITDITSASPAVITAAAHGFSDGDNVYISGVVGMTELNGNVYTVANATINTFTLTYFEQASSSMSASISASVSASPSI